MFSNDQEPSLVVRKKREYTKRKRKPASMDRRAVPPLVQPPTYSNLNTFSLDAYSTDDDALSVGLPDF